MQLETQEADFNIRSIFHRQHGHPDHISCPDGIEPVYRNCPPLKSLLVNRQHSSDSESSVSSLELAASRRNIQVNGGDIGDLPAQYNVQGLRLNEVPVIGMYVDRRVVPGFCYKIRKLDSNQYMFGGQVVRVSSIGMGYGKRITLEPDSPNEKDNYFYSDTHPGGYAFSLRALTGKEKFIVFDQEQRTVAQAGIQRVHVENEATTDVDSDGNVIKTVSAMFTCSLRFKRVASLLPLLSQQIVQLQGTVILIKERRVKSARIACIKDVMVKHVGSCTFELC